jgi:nucleotide-binding universal stress UspA family protein
MYAKTLAEHVSAYLGLQTFLDECRADGVDTQPAARAVAQARREIFDALRKPSGGDAAAGAADGSTALATATRAYLEAEHDFDRCDAAGVDLDAPARRMEVARRALARMVREVTGEDAAPPAVREAGTAGRVSRAARHPRRILVAYDESAPALWALEVAVRTAQEAGGALRLVHVVRPATGAGVEFVSSLERLDTMHHREAAEMLEGVRKSLPRGLEVDHVVREGQPAEEILAAAKAWDAEEIVIGTRARGRLAQFLLGSTAEDVIRRAACPVVTVGRRAAWAVDAKAAGIGSKETATA